MSVSTLISVDEYLHTSYRPDREYRDGALVERNVGDRSHSELQRALTQYFSIRRKAWNIAVYPEMRIRARKGWFPVPDICIYRLPGPEEQVPDRLPYLWIEVLSPDDKVPELWKRAKEAITLGTPYFWVIEPKTLESDLWTPGGRTAVADYTLRLPDSPIVVPLRDALEE